MNSGKIPVSIMIPARNESSNIGACIQSVADAADVVVVDSGSEDDTVEIARELGARVVNFKWNGKLPKKKNWALDNVEWPFDWVFILDADERWTPELASEVRKVINTSDGCDGYYVNRRFWFLDGWLKHCGYYPSWNLRLFRPTKGRYEQLPDIADTLSGDNEVHEHVLMEGPTGRLAHDMDHLAFPSIDIWVEKHNRYSSWEARMDLVPSAQDMASKSRLKADLAVKRRIRQWSRRLPFRSTLRFLYHYILRAGFMDGYRGWVFCRLLAFYEFLGVAKAAEARRSKEHSKP